MRYEISCFIQDTVFTSPNSPEKLKSSVMLIEKIISRIGTGFTLELRDLKTGALVHHAVRVNADAIDNDRPPRPCA